jgi:hypothetical protein
MPPQASPPDPDDGRGGWRSLAVLGFLLLVALGCVWLTRTLRHEAQIEDCLAAGRRDCDRVAAGR